MKKGLQKILNEFDPRHDLDRVKPLWDYFQKFGEEPLKSFGGAIYWGANGFVKSIVRYGLPAMVVGALGAYIIGENPNVGAMWFGAIVAGTDVCQYGVRSSVIPITRDLFNFFKNLLIVR